MLDEINVVQPDTQTSQIVDGASPGLMTQARMNVKEAQLGAKEQEFMDFYHKQLRELSQDTDLSEDEKKLKAMGRAVKKQILSISDPRENASYLKIIKHLDLEDLILKRK